MIHTYGDGTLIRKVRLEEPAVSVEEHLDRVGAAIREQHTMRILELGAQAVQYLEKGSRIAMLELHSGSIFFACQGQLVQMPSAQLGVSLFRSALCARSIAGNVLEHVRKQTTEARVYCEERVEH